MSAERVVHPRSAAWKLAKERETTEAALNYLGFLLPILDSVRDHVEYKDEYERRVRLRSIQIGTILAMQDLGERFLIWMGVESSKPRGKRI